MRKAILFSLLAATMVPGIASAQSAGELRGDRRDIRQEQRDVERARANGASPAAIRDERRDVQGARQEYREDARDYRRAHPDVYRGARYIGPRGYTYRPVIVGYRFAPTYYDRRYWIDPARYHLAPAGRYEQWIRYGNDAVLINVRTGRTIRVYNRLFY